MLKSADDGLSHKWRVEKRQGAAYTGGDIAMVGRTHAACLCFDRVALLNIESGVVDRFLPQQDSVRTRHEWHVTPLQKRASAASLTIPVFLAGGSGRAHCLLRRQR